MPRHLDPRGLHPAGGAGGIGDDLLRPLRQIGTVPVEEHQVGPRHLRRRDRRRHRCGGDRRRVEGVAQAEQDGVVAVVRLEAAGHARHRRPAGAADVEFRVQRAEEAVLRRHRQARRHIAQPEGRADDGLVGELRVGVVDPEAAAADREARLADLVPDIAAADAEIGLVGRGRDAEIRQVEVEQQVRHRPIPVVVARAADAGAVQRQPLDLVVAVIALDLRPPAIAEAPAERQHAGEAGFAGGQADAVVIAVGRKIQAGTGPEIKSLHRLRPGGEGCREQGGGEEKAAERHRQLQGKPGSLPAIGG